MDNDNKHVQLVELIILINQERDEGGKIRYGFFSNLRVRTLRYRHKGSMLFASIQMDSPELTNETAEKPPTRSHDIKPRLTIITKHLQNRTYKDVPEIALGQSSEEKLRGSEGWKKDLLKRNAKRDGSSLTETGLIHAQPGSPSIDGRRPLRFYDPDINGAKVTECWEPEIKNRIAMTLEPANDVVMYTVTKCTNGSGQSRVRSLLTSASLRLDFVFSGRCSRKDKEEKHNGSNDFTSRTNTRCNVTELLDRTSPVVKIPMRRHGPIGLLRRSTIKKKHEKKTRANIRIPELGFRFEIDSRKNEDENEERNSSSGSNGSKRIRRRRISLVPLKNVPNEITNKPENGRSQLLLAMLENQITTSSSTLFSLAFPTSSTKRFQVLNVSAALKCAVRMYYIGNAGVRVINERQRLKHVGLYNQTMRNKRYEKWNGVMHVLVFRDEADHHATTTTIIDAVASAAAATTGGAATAAAASYYYYYSRDVDTSKRDSSIGEESDEYVSEEGARCHIPRTRSNWNESKHLRRIKGTPYAVGLEKSATLKLDSICILPSFILFRIVCIHVSFDTYDFEQQQQTNKQTNNDDDDEDDDYYSHRLNNNILFSKSCMSLETPTKNRSNRNNSSPNGEKDKLTTIKSQLSLTEVYKKYLGTKDEPVERNRSGLRGKTGCKTEREKYGQSPGYSPATITKRNNIHVSMSLPAAKRSWKPPEVAEDDEKEVVVVPMAKPVVVMPLLVVSVSELVVVAVLVGVTVVMVVVLSLAKHFEAT
ncbi:LOW QUALITY PROTEIN: hypothetical protein V1478_002540 [Vespula squamosa]|uniref:Uncharacterized protein n=1 Tax=Vespula squamosa TaxID=30214 RepID=A0ABD2BSW6_VESSQ